MKFEYTPIGIIHSPFSEPLNMPIQPVGGMGIQGTVEVYPQYRPGLRDLEGFSYIILLYHFHRSKGFDLNVIPFLDSVLRGLFATRAPRRPNPIGLSIVQLIKIQDGILYIRNLDILDGTPLLDIKPYVPELDAVTSVRTGWLGNISKSFAREKSDARFTPEQENE